MYIFPYSDTHFLYGRNTMNNTHDKTVSKSYQIRYNCNLYDDEWRSHDPWLLELYWGFRCTGWVLLTVLIPNTRVHCEWGKGWSLCIHEEHTDQKYCATWSRRNKAGSSIKNWQHLRDLYLLESVPADPYSTPWHIWTTNSSISPLCSHHRQVQGKASW